jgi:predicted PurR-regulated permease PerM
MRPSMPSEPLELKARRQQRALGALAIVAAIVLVRLALPFGVGLFLGALLAFTLQPLYGNLRRRHWKAGSAAMLCSLSATIFMAAAVVGVTVLFVSRSMSLLAALPAALAPDGTLGRFAADATKTLTAMHVPVPDLTAKLQAEAVTWGTRAAAIAAQIAGATFAGVLTFFFMSLSTYFVLRHWTELVRRAEELLPFERKHTHELLNQFRKVGRQVLLGTLVTGIIQGIFAAVGYELTGVPEPGFWGVVTAMASLVPAVGTLLVWVPMGIYKIMTGHVAAGLIGLVYNALTVGVISDYIIRPRLVGHERGVPTMLTFIALFGGVEVFGIVGLVLGPVLVTLSFAILRTYQESLASTAA